MTTMASTFQNSGKQTRLLFFLIFICAILLRLYLVTLDMNVLLDQGLVQDDAFYYYVIARHIIEHGHSSFDGLNLTNGYHPLWQAICLPVFYLWSGDTAVRVMLGIASFFDLLSIILFYKILCRMINSPYVVLSGVAILAFHGTIIRTWFNGLETALSIFSLLLLLDYFLTTKLKKLPSLKDHVWFGCIAAFAFLSRTDNAVIIVTVFSFLYLPLLFSKKEIANGSAACAILLLLVSPWLIWNMVHFGSIVQISGQIHDNTWLVNSLTTNQKTYMEVFFELLTSMSFIRIVFEKMFSPLSYVPLPGTVYFFILSFFIFRGKNNENFRNGISKTLPFLTGVVLLFLYHTCVRHFVRGWYNAPVLLVLTMLVCLLLDVMVTKIKSDVGNQSVLPVTGTVLLLFFSPYYYTRSPQNMTLDPRIAAAQWINENTDPQAIVGAANAGIMGYYTRRTVINLDGVVNEQAFHARLANQLHQYIQETRINYLADHKGSIAYLCKENSFYSCTRADNLQSSTWVMRVNR